jgi:voltage-gated potassium channel
VVQGPVESKAGRPRSPEDARRLARFDAAMAFPLVLAALLPLVLLPGDDTSLFAAAVNIVAWIVFLVDFIVHERRLEHYLATWLGRFDLLVVVLTAPWFLLPGPGESRFVILIRLARVARLLMAGTGARRLFERIGRVAVIAVAVVVIGAAAAYRAEHPSNPEFATFGDSLWWAVVTLTTVGYGDIVPKTTAGRLTGFMIMVTGVGILGVLAGSLASFFRIHGADGETSDDDREPPADLTTQVVELRGQVAALTGQISRLAAHIEQTSKPSE